MQMPNSVSQIPIPTKKINMFSEKNSIHHFEIEKSDIDYSVSFKPMLPTYRTGMLQSVNVRLQKTLSLKKMKGVIFYMKNHKDKLLIIEMDDQSAHVLFTAQGRRKFNEFNTKWCVEVYSKIIATSGTNDIYFFYKTEAIDKFIDGCWVSSKHQRKRKRQKEKQKDLLLKLQKFKERSAKIKLILKISGLLLALIVLLLTIYFL